jgi:hypothetical protein
MSSQDRPQAPLPQRVPRGWVAVLAAASGRRCRAAGVVVDASRGPEREAAAELLAHHLRATEREDRP